MWGEEWGGREGENEEERNERRRREGGGGERRWLASVSGCSLSHTHFHLTNLFPEIDFKK